jgi:hypothetical protein
MVDRDAFASHQCMKAAVAEAPPLVRQLDQALCEPCFPPNLARQP